MATRLQIGMAVLLLFAVAHAVLAQGTTPSSSPPRSARPPYLPDRSAEDWSFLRDPSKRNDPWDPIKYIPLNDEGSWFISVGGEIRPFFEFYRNYNWGATPATDDGFYLQRLMMHADLHMTRSARLFVELKSGLEVARVGGPRPPDEDKIDLNQAFLDVHHGFRADRSLFTFRIGRQEMNYGDGSLISFREGPNVRRGFDGMKIIVRPGTWQIDTFAVKPVQTKAGYFDDGAEPGQTLWGVYVASQTPVLQVLGRMDAYYLGLDRKQVRFDQGVARDQRHTVGVRSKNKVRGLEYEFEGDFQFGKFGDGDIRAWKFVHASSYRFEKTRLRPLIGLNFAISSGDKDPDDPDLQTFHPLFPKGLYYGYIDDTGSLNAIVLHPRSNFQITKTVSLTVETFYFWRQRTTDGIYSQPGVFLRTGQQSDARFLGTLYEAEVVWRVDPHTTVALEAARYDTGEYFRDTPPDRNITYFSAKVSYKF